MLNVGLACQYQSYELVAVSYTHLSKKAVSEVRESIAKSLGAATNEIYFTAGGSEADNWAIKATAEAYAQKGKHIITSAIEHHAVLHTCEYLEKRGFEVTYVAVSYTHLGLQPGR